MARKRKKQTRDQKAEEQRIRRENRAENKDRRQDDDNDRVKVVKLDPENEEELYGPEGETRLTFEVIDADNNEEAVMAELDDFTDEDSTVSGEESVGGSTPTPDQDIVDELGQALGIGYEDYEPLHTADKLEDRDQDRWELNPASVEEIEEQEDEMEDQDEDETARYLEGDFDVEMVADKDLEEEDVDAGDNEGTEVDLLAEDLDEEDDDEFDLDDDDLDEYLDELEDEEDE
jgi:hypothetical protein